MSAVASGGRRAPADLTEGSPAMKDGLEPVWDELSSPAVAVSSEASSEVGFVAARVRLLRLLHAGFLHSACALAYHSAVAAHAGRAVPRMTPLATIAEPQASRAGVIVPLRCDIDFGSGRIGPVLEAELAFRPMTGSTAVRFDGVFRFPAADRAERAEDVREWIRAAQSGAESLLSQLAEALTFEGEAEALNRPGWR